MERDTGSGKGYIEDQGIHGKAEDTGKVNDTGKGKYTGNGKGYRAVQEIQRWEMLQGRARDIGKREGYREGIHGYREGQWIQGRARDTGKGKGYREG